MASPLEVEEFLRWATTMGVTDGSNNNNPLSCLGSSLFVSNFPDAGGRGLAAAWDLEKGELILKVPKSALMSRESLIAEGRELAKSLYRHPNLSSTQVLVIYLLSEVAKGNNSLWHPYLLQLPRNYNILATFTDFEAQALQVEDAVWVAQRATTVICQEWKESQMLMNEIGLKHRFTNFSSWLWAFATVSSRTLHVPWDAAGCLCPVGDLFNYAAPGDDVEIVEVKREADHSVSSGKRNYQDESHSSTAVTRNCEEESKMDETLFLHPKLLNEVSDNVWNDSTERLTDGIYETELGAYCFYAREKYLQGDQVLLCYGVYTNLELLEHYGFVIKDNPNDKIFIDLDDDMMTLRYWEKNHLYLQWDGKPSFSLLVALRFCAAPSNLRKAVGHLAFSGLQICVDNDIAVTKWLLERCQTLLAKLPTTIEEDELLVDIIDRCLEPDGMQFILDLIQDTEMGQYNNKSVLLDQFPKWSGLHTKRCQRLIGDISTFFKINFLQRYDAIDLSHKTRIVHSLNRWKLAIQWRLGYKTILHRGILYCNCQLKHLYTARQ